MEAVERKAIERASRIAIGEEANLRSTLKSLFTQLFD